MIHCQYKGKHKDLVAAYQQLLQYREALENLKLLIVCDLNRFEIHTNFTDMAKKVYAFDLDGLADPDNLDVLRRVFTDPESLKPGQTSRAITEQAAELFGQLADGMRVRGIAAHDAAHFLMKLMFCMFAEDIELLPSRVFWRLLDGAKKDSSRLGKLLHNLFEAMSAGGNFGADEILYFNGGLFADVQVIDLKPAEINVLSTVATFDWSVVEPSIFGTLFERTLDPEKRSQIGAHYTSRQDIETLLRPVMLAPLRREWDEVRRQAAELVTKFKTGAAAAAGAGRAKSGRGKESKPRRDFDRRLRDFVERLAHVTVLDPACGSGNFLYVALHLLLDLEKEVITFAAHHGLGLLPQVRPTQLHGIEINPYAQELAQVVIWIGYLQWMRDNGFAPPRHPVLEPIESIQRMDAILDLSDPKHPTEPDWPAADFIVGNPPFLGTKKLRSELGDDYVDTMFAMFGDRIPPFSDLCCYWFEKARRHIERKKCKRAGLLATQGIRGGLNREVLNRIKATGDIFLAYSDRDWILDGANVHVSIVGFDDGSDQERTIDGNRVQVINSNLTATADITKSKRLTENQGIGFIADVKAGKFDITSDEAVPLLTLPNPHLRPNSDVVRPWVNGLDITQRPRNVWIIDFGSDMTLEAASCYEAPLAVVRERVKPARDKVKRKSYRDFWWIHAEPCDEMRRKIETLDRFLATTIVSKHRLFAWLRPPILADHQLVVFASSDDYFFGVLHSRVHEVWARSQGTQVRERESGFRYTPTTCFETFPFPEPTSAQREAIAEAARELDRLRTHWLNPPEWVREQVLTFPGSVAGPWSRFIDPATVTTSSRAASLSPLPPGEGSWREVRERRASTGPHPNPLPKGEGARTETGIGTVRYPRLVPKDEGCAKELKKRTLTNLYNQRPTWLDLAHKHLDEAVFAVYGWPPSLSDDDLLAKLLALNLERAANEQMYKQLTAKTESMRGC